VGRLVFVLRIQFVSEPSLSTIIITTFAQQISLLAAQVISSSYIYSGKIIPLLKSNNTIKKFLVEAI
jgi:hypothetical protein